MKYKSCDCDPLEYCEHMRKNVDIYKSDATWTPRQISEQSAKRLANTLDSIKEIMKEKKMTTRCNCDASCGENRYHDVGDPGCRFKTEAEYDMYWRNRTPEWVEQRRLDAVEKTARETKPSPSDSMTFESVNRPWGKWSVIDVDQGYKVKRLEILPDQSISLQYHNHRSEHWTIVQGKGRVIIDGNIFNVEKGESFYVPKTALHKITNTHLTETLIAIEVQMGEICREDDIVRC